MIDFLKIFIASQKCSSVDLANQDYFSEYMFYTVRETISFLHVTDRLLTNIRFHRFDIIK